MRRAVTLFDIKNRKENLTFVNNQSTKVLKSDLWHQRKLYHRFCLSIFYLDFFFPCNLSHIYAYMHVVLYYYIQYQQWIYIVHSMSNNWLIKRIYKSECPFGNGEIQLLSNRCFNVFVEYMAPYFPPVNTCIILWPFIGVLWYKSYIP